jgi:hypothetical protein
MSSTSRQWLVVTASGVLSALMVGLPSQAEPRQAEPVLEFA